MENKLSRLFDYQKYAGNKALADVIADVESRHPQAVELSDDELFEVAAAGLPDGQPDNDKFKGEKPNFFDKI